MAEHEGENVTLKSVTLCQNTIMCFDTLPIQICIFLLLSLLFDIVIVENA